MRRVARGRVASLTVTVILLMGPLLGIASGQQYLYVSTYLTDGTIEKYDLGTRAHVGCFTSIGSEHYDLAWPQIGFGPDGKLYGGGLEAAAAAQITRYDPVSGAIIDKIGPPTGGAFAFGPDGYLYVSTYLTDGTIEKYDLGTRAHVGCFTSIGSEHYDLAWPQIGFGPDGKLYGGGLEAAAAAQITRYDPVSGAIIDKIGPPTGGAFAFAAPKSRMLSVGVSWGGTLRGDLDAENIRDAFAGFLSSWDTGQALVLDCSRGDGTNLGGFQAALGTISQGLGRNDTLILSFASHGDSLVTGTEPAFNTDRGDGTTEMRTGDEYVLLADEDNDQDDSDRLYDDALRDMIAQPALAGVRKIVIFDNCRSGGFGPDLTQTVSNIAVLAACSEGGFAYSARDGTGVFTNLVIEGLSDGSDGFPKADQSKDGTVTIDELDVYIAAFDFGDLMGQSLPLRYLSGERVFDGLALNYWSSSDFDGIIIPEPATLVVLTLGGSTLLRRRKLRPIRESRD